MSTQKLSSLQTEILYVLHEGADEGRQLSVEDRDRLLRQTLGLLLNVLHPGPTSEETLIERYAQDVLQYRTDTSQILHFLQLMCDNTFLHETDSVRARLVDFMNRLRPHLVRPQ